MKKNFIYMNEEPGGDGAGGSGDDTGIVDNDTAVTRPDYVPEKFWNPESGEVRLQEMASSYSSLESKIGANREAYFNEFEQGRMANRPESAEQYEVRLDAKELGLPEDTAVNINPEDPMLAWWKSVAFENGYSNDQFNAGVQEYLKNDLKSLPNMDAEREALGEGAQDRINRVELWARKTAGDELFDKVQFALGNADSVIFLEKIMKSQSSIDFGSEGGQAPGKLTRTELQAMQDDPRYWKTRDPDYIQKVNDAWGRFSAQKG